MSRPRFYQSLTTATDAPHDGTLVVSGSKRSLLRSVLLPLAFVTTSGVIGAQTSRSVNPLGDGHRKPATKERRERRRKKSKRR